MTIIIGYKKGTVGKTVTALVGALGEDAIGLMLGGKSRAYKVIEGARVYIDIPEEGVFFRYGWRGAVPRGLRLMGEYGNTKLITDKFGFRTWAAGHSKIEVPLSWQGKSNIFPIKYPILWRPMNHTQGKEYIILKDNNQKWEFRHSTEYNYEEGYFSELVAKSAEYRVYTFNGYVWGMSQKTPLADVSEYDAWNFSKGNATFKILNSDAWNKKATFAASYCAVQLGLMHAAFDVIIDEYGFALLLEGNNAPALLGKQKPKQFARHLRYLEEYTLNKKEIPQLGEGTSNKSPWLKRR